MDIIRIEIEGRVMRKKERGSITVFFTMLLIPIIILVSLFVDLSRVKLYGTQATMMADNYAEGVLSEYDNLLKEMYGLFAVSQTSDKFKEIKEYAKTSMEINHQHIQYALLKGTFINPEKNYKGFIPYRSEDLVIEDYEKVEKANLRNEKILGSQIADFMKIRIAKVIADMVKRGGNDILETLDMIQKMKPNMDVVNSKKTLDKEVGDVLKRIKEYYEELEKIDEYCEKYLKGLNNNFQNIKQEMINYVYENNPSGYQEYLDALKEMISMYKEEKEEEERKKKEAENQKEDSTPKVSLSKEELEAKLTLEQQKRAEKEKKITNYNEKRKAAEDKFQNMFEAYLQLYTDGEAKANNTGKVVFKDFNDHIDGVKIIVQGKEHGINGLRTIAEEVEKSIKNAKGYLETLDKDLENKNVSPDLKDNMEIELESYRDLLGVPRKGESEAKYKIYYKELANYVAQNKENNDEFWKSAEKIKTYLVEGVKKYFLDVIPEEIEKDSEFQEIMEEFKNERGFQFSKEFIDNFENTYHFEEGNGSNNGFKKLIESRTVLKGALEIEISKYKDFKKEDEYKKLFEDLQKSFMDGGENKDLKNFEKDMKQLKEDKEKELKEMKEDAEDKNIPETIPLYPSESEKGGSIDIFGSMGELNKDVLDMALTKIYTIFYDFEMFSDRVDKHRYDSKGLSLGDCGKVEISTDKEGKKTGKTSSFKTLTGFDKTKINYFFGGEMEYLIGGNRNLRENLNSVRNTISLFRAAMNFASSYTVKEVNTAINSASAAASALPPLAVAIQLGARGGFAAIESLDDWNKLKKGCSVPVLKLKMGETSAGSLIVDKVPKSVAGKGKHISNASAKENFNISLDYKQYLTIMLLIGRTTETIINRTGDLIMVNLNYKGGEGDLTNPNFKLEEAVTAVKGTTEVGMKFFMLPDGFAGRKSQDKSYENLGTLTKRTIEKGTYEKMKEFEGNKYKFSVIRGY